MKKKITAALALLLLTLVVGSTYAYYVDIDDATNVITTGNIDIGVHETKLVGGMEKPYEGVVEVMPGTDVSKIVRIQNKGDHAAYVRVAVDKVINLANGSLGDADFISVDFNKTKWKYKEGYYYYTKALAPGSETEALFEHVLFNSSMPNAYQNSTAKITVTAYATQVKNNDSNGALGAMGWPEK